MSGHHHVENYSQASQKATCHPGKGPGQEEGFHQGRASKQAAAHVRCRGVCSSPPRAEIQTPSMPLLARHYEVLVTLTLAHLIMRGASVCYRLESLKDLQLLQASRQSPQSSALEARSSACSQSASHPGGTNLRAVAWSGSLQRGRLTVSSVNHLGFC